MEYLYVCHFSNGHIKVGRSIDPEARIAAHADRVACMGVELIEHHFTACTDRSAPAESELINRCAGAASKRNKSEWFEGLDYEVVLAWMCDVAQMRFDAKKVAAPRGQNWGAIINDIRVYGGFTLAEIAERVGGSQGAISDLSNSRTKEPGYDIGAALIDLLKAINPLAAPDLAPDSSTQQAT